MPTARNGPQRNSRARGRSGSSACSTAPPRSPWQRHRAGSSEILPDPAVDHGSTRGERIANWVTHGLGLAVSILAFALLVVSSSLYGDAWHIVSFSVFGAALLLLYSIWMLYHAWDSERGRRLILKLGRASAFLLIAGTYTPFLLVSMRGPWGWTLFGIVWGLCAAGIVFQFIVGNRYRVTSTLAGPVRRLDHRGGDKAAVCRRAPRRRLAPAGWRPLLHGWRDAGPAQAPALSLRNQERACAGRQHVPPAGGPAVRAAACTARRPGRKR